MHNNKAHERAAKGPLCWLSFSLNFTGVNIVYGLFKADFYFLHLHIIFYLLSLHNL